VRRRRGFGAVTFNDEESRTMAGDVLLGSLQLKEEERDDEGLKREDEDGMDSSGGGGALVSQSRQ
jgi:hypothetical protein